MSSSLTTHLSQPYNQTVYDSRVKTNISLTHLSQPYNQRVYDSRLIYHWQILSQTYNQRVYDSRLIYQRKIRARNIQLLLGQPWNWFYCKRTTKVKREFSRPFQEDFNIIFVWINTGYPSKHNSSSMTVKSSLIFKFSRQPIWICNN